MSFVIDASVAACWAFDDEDHPAAALALERIQFEDARAPSLWWYELRNTLLVNERRKRLTERNTTAFLQFVSGLRLTIDRAPVESAVLGLARRHRLTVYDASYLELACRDGLHLATLDQALAKAAQAEGVLLMSKTT